MADAQRREGTPPIFSIVIPTHARPDGLRACLAGIAALRTSRTAFEVIVVSDGGAETTASLRAGLPDDLAVTAVNQPRGGPGSARNAGARLAGGRYLAFIDDDCVPDSEWLNALSRAFEDDDRRLLGGRVENALTGSAWSDASERITEFVYEHNRKPTAREPFFTTNNIAVRADLFESLGGFLTTIPAHTAEDKEFCTRWRASGLALAHVPDAVVKHAHHLTLRRFLRQHFNYGRGILAIRLMRKARSQTRLVPEPSGFYVNLVLSPLRTQTGKRSLRASLLIALAQVATAAGATAQAVRWPLDRPVAEGERSR